MPNTARLIRNSFKLFIILGIHIFSGVFSLNAAGLIKGPSHVCIGNLAYFSLSDPGNVKSCNWKFGDGYTSVGKSPFHLYKKPGAYQLNLEIELNDGSKASDSMMIEVDALPKAELLVNFGNDSCLYTNLFKLIDKSLPSKPSNKIEKRLILWGDGDFENHSNPAYGDTLKHHYEMKDRYKVKMEITDIRGCKSSDVKYFNVIDGTLARIKADITYPSCGEASVCFTNASLSSNGSSQVYIWNFDSSGFQSLAYSQQTCFSAKKSKFVRAYLLLSNADQTCKSEDYVNIYLDADSLKNEFSIQDSVFCYGAKNGLQVYNTSQKYSYDWWLDNNKTPNNTQNFIASAKFLNLNPGMHQIRCRVSKGPCFEEYNATFRIKGPVARMKIFNQTQCEIDKRVFFIDTSLNLDRKHARYNWQVVDPEGENCVIHRAINQNKFRNCNISRDWFGKHDYTIPRVSNRITLEITDTLAKCSDSTTGFVEHFHCKICDCRPGGVSLCQYDTFLQLREKEIGPLFFSLDTGKTWLKFPSEIPKPYKGWYGVSFIFKNTEPDRAEDFGNDSIKVFRSDTFWMDTIFAPDFLFVREARNSDMEISVKLGSCKPFKAEIKMKDSMFFNGDIVQIDWKDGSSDYIKFDKDTVVLSFEHLYRLSGLDDQVKITLISRDACTRTKILPLKFGRSIKLLETGKPCRNEKICFNAEIINHNNDSRYNAFKEAEWEIKDSSERKTGKSFCESWNSSGEKQLVFYGTDSLDCRDTLKLPVIIRELKAGILQDSRVFYCNEMKQLFDSSYHVYKDINDKITEYYWDFGSGMFTTLEKDPFRSFEIKDSLIPVTHIVSDNNGCRDTFSYQLEIVGSQPSFTITDTIGCAPFRAIFSNKSRKCAAYIWEFNDPLNTTFENKDLSTVSFDYLKEGKYYPKLIGIDTFYNPYTGSVYYCNAAFDPGIAITVHKTYSGKFETADTICLGEISVFKCESNTPSVWLDFGNGSRILKNLPPNEVKYQYPLPGKYKAQIKPYYSLLPGQPRCVDSAEQTIVVLGVVADFEIESKSDAPIFYFKNLSGPSDAALLWNFGQASSGADNTSTLQNPSHNYKKETGQFNVCLIATVENRCWDSVCKPIINDYVQSVKLYNVFTPGFSDSLNDDYEVSIRGESEYHLIIYDRWGVKVYESETDSEPGEGLNWNGRVFNNGNECPSGTYYYIFRYAFKIDPEKVYTTNGTVSLIR